MIAYRFEFWTFTVMQWLMMISIGFFWKSVYDGVDTAHGVSENAMTTYTVISSIMSSLFFMGVEDRITDAVKTGSIATDMIKPINLFSMYFAEDIGNLIISFIRSTIPTFLIGWLIFGLPAPASSQHLGLFFLSFILSYGINWTFSAFFAMIAFTAISMGPAFSVKYHFINLLSGAIIPIWFFPEWLQNVVNFLPFVYIYQTPLSIYIGKYEINECLQMVGIQAIWFVIFAVVFYFAQRQATKRVLVQGG